MDTATNSGDESMFVIDIIDENIVVIDQGKLHGITPGQRILFYEIVTSKPAEYEIDKAPIQNPKGEGTVSNVYSEKSIVKIDMRYFEKIPESNWANIAPLNRPEFYREVPSPIEKGDRAEII